MRRWMLLAVLACTGCAAKTPATNTPAFFNQYSTPEIFNRRADRGPSPTAPTIAVRTTS